MTPLHQVIANWTGPCMGNMMSDEIAKLLTLEDELNTRVIGQDVAKNEL
ncbi:hypothetical protein O9992_00245 [Vibrio lentus]|nr:hypothetical protein [Vibrio lentus]